jgi:hypothetical protein
MNLARRQLNTAQKRAMIEMQLRKPCLDDAPAGLKRPPSGIRDLEPDPTQRLGAGLDALRICGRQSRADGSR